MVILYLIEHGIKEIYQNIIENCILNIENYASHEVAHA